MLTLPLLQGNKKMRRLWPLFLFITIFVAVSVTHYSTTVAPQVEQTSTKRIISLSPSVTEVIFALGAENKLIAVSDFCDYPPQTETLPKVGGYIDPSLEKITALNPDLVILLANQQQTIKQLSQLHIPVLTVKNSTLEEIKISIQDVAASLDHVAQGRALLEKIDSTTRYIQQRVSGKNRPHVVITMGHSGNSTSFKQFYIAGQHDFYNDLLHIAGGQNAYQLDKPAVPTVSVEGLMMLDPDIIIDIFPDANDHNASISQIKQQWAKLSELKAVKGNQVHIIEEDYATIPGPRIFLLLQSLAPIIHPGLAWHEFDDQN